MPGPDTLDLEGRSGVLGDLHYTVPAKALVMARALGVLPPTVFILGCQVERMELGDRLSEAVEAALPEAEARIRSLCAELAPSPPAAAEPPGLHCPEESEERAS